MTFLCPLSFRTEPYSSRLCRMLVVVQCGLLFFGLPWYNDAYTEQDIYSVSQLWRFNKNGGGGGHFSRPSPVYTTCCAVCCALLGADSC